MLNVLFESSCLEVRNISFERVDDRLTLCIRDWSGEDTIAAPVVHYKDRHVSVGGADGKIAGEVGIHRAFFLVNNC